MLKTALALHRSGRLHEAAALYRRLLQENPKDADALHLLGVIEAHNGNPLDGLRLIDVAIAIRPNTAAFHSNRGNVLKEVKRFGEALASYDRALALKPDHADAQNNRGVVLHELGRLGEALESYGRAVALNPGYADAYVNRSAALLELNRFDEALADYDRALAINPGLVFAPGDRLFCKMLMCDWRGLENDFARLGNALAAGKPVSTPFPVLAMPFSAGLLRRCSEIYACEMAPEAPPAPAFENRAAHEKIRLGYFSADFHQHATANLTAELFERHDRSRFELIAFSFGPAGKDAMTARLEKSFDRFVDIDALSDRDAAALAREHEIDIAIDLKGYTQDHRAGIFAHRAAPVQVNYLGYPGTMGARYIDYLIADRILIPAEHRQHYAERIAYLPDSYQVNDTRRPVAERTFARGECGLPENGFVFCCFNKSYKIAPEIFGIWMRLLGQVEGSVLWLLEDNGFAEKNLKAEARSRGIAPERLVFAKRMSLPEHLARHRLADLFLDTLPCNAHTTASDALWGGLPVLTCLGETFAGRVAASLLHAAGLPELVTRDLKTYETRALELATKPQELRRLKQHLGEHRSTTPLFDSARFTRHIEFAYIAMWERHRAGLPPDHIQV